MRLPKPGDMLLDKYRIEAVLGQGGYGVVYHATTISTGRPVAIKVLKAGESLEATARVSRFLREMRAIARLKSPHTITLFDYGKLDDGAPFMVCEFVGGEDLYELLNRRGPLSVVEAIHILKQILESLAEAHETGILHRDVKPSNVRVFEFGDDTLRVKMLDFGLAKSLRDDEARLTGTGNVVGTPRYMSPEQIHGRPLTPATDIYGAGLVAVEMLLGPEAFRELPTIGERLLDVRLPIDARIIEIVNRMVTDDLSSRWQKARDVLSALNSDAPLSSRPERRIATIPAPARSTKQPRPAPAGEPGRAPMWLALGSLAVLGVVSGVAVGLATLDNEEPADVTVATTVAEPTSLPMPAVRSNPPPPIRELPPLPDAGPPARVAGTAGCGGERLAGVRAVSVLDGLAARAHPVYVPTAYDPDVPHALVLLLHESAVSPSEFIDVSGFVPIAEEHGVVIAAPWGGAPEAWTGNSHLAAAEALEDVKETLCIDPQRMFVVGHSSGGGVAEHSGCRLRGIRAIATTAHRRRVSGKPACPDVAMPAIHIVGREDGYNPLDGGKSCSGSIKATLAHKEQSWVARNGCAANARTTWIRKGASKCVGWEDCDQPLVSCVLDGGRGWNGSGDRIMDVLDCDGEPADFEYAQTIWKFFQSVEQRSAR